MLLHGCIDIRNSTFLSRRDARWGTLLETIRQRSTNPYTEEDVKEIFVLIGVRSVDLMARFKAQLYEYLETYTEGLTHSMVMAGGSMNAMEAFRQLCDEGFSARDRNLRKEYRKVSHPKQATYETLKRAILDWENELAQYELASGKVMTEADKIMCLEDICPDGLQQHFETKEGLKTYAACKPVINDFLANRARWGVKGTLNWSGIPEAEDVEAESDEQEEARVAQIEAIIGQIPQLNAVTGEISAILRNKMSKAQKGRGKKGGGVGKQTPIAGKDQDVDMSNGGKAVGGKGRRKCFECDEEGHIAAECSVRTQRVLAGGPERLPKGKGKGKGVLAWKQWEGPLRWHPAAIAGGSGKGPAANAFWGAPFQLAAAGAAQTPGAAILQSLFEGPTPDVCVSIESSSTEKRIPERAPPERVSFRQWKSISSFDRG